MKVQPIVPRLDAMPSLPPERETQLRAASQAFEATFLAEMLKHAGLTGRDGEFSGGAGEDAFSSMLTQEYAQALTESGGIGISEWVYQALLQKEGG